MINKQYTLPFIACLFMTTVSMGQITMNKNLQMTGAMAADRTITGVTNVYLDGKIIIDGVTFVDNKNAANVLVGDTKNAVLTGNNNIFIGTNAGRFAANSSSAIFVGYQAGLGNTNYDGAIGLGVGAAGSNKANYNTMAGYQAGYNTGMGAENTFLGCNAGKDNTIFASNVSLGFHAGVTGMMPMFGGLTTAIGPFAGSNETTKSLFVGYYADGAMDNLTNVTGIGTFAKPSNDNTMMIGGDGGGGIQINIGINTDKPRSVLDINATGAVIVPVGTTMQRPTAVKGMVRYNTTTNKMEVYNGAAWKNFNY